ncbi:MAG: lactate racemase domain-containing protein [bacterium]
MVIGKGAADKILTDAEIIEICEQAFSRNDFDARRILVVLPDHTRTAPVDKMFRVVHKLLAKRSKKLDFVIALGTHPPMSEARINQHLGISQRERSTQFANSRIFNHQWDAPDQLRPVGAISEDEVAHLSNGLMRQAVEIKINKLVFDYDLLLVVGPTFPHEVVGFSGGNKYFFPGLAGPEIIHMFHWLGALITSPAIIGVKHTPVRKVVDKAASFLPMPRWCLSLVVKGSDLAGLFFGSPEEAWSAAADLSRNLHIVYKERPFQKVLSCAPTMYEDLWTGGKCVYKLEPVVADGGELIVYAPHIREISVTHGAVIEKIGYHCRDYFIMQPEKFTDIPRGVMAHSTHVKGIGRFENGREEPRIEVVLATQITPDLCKRIHLGYRDPDTIDIEGWRDREQEGILCVSKAGEMLYRLQNDPFHKTKNEEE